MNIDLTAKQQAEFLEDKYINIKAKNYRIYLELTNDDDPFYMEVVRSKDGKTIKGYSFDATELEKLVPKRPRDPSYYHNDPLCPCCGTYLIYHFEHCPKCGQKIDWSEG